MVKKAIMKVSHGLARLRRSPMFDILELQV